MVLSVDLGGARVPQGGGWVPPAVLLQILPVVRGEVVPNPQQLPGGEQRELLVQLLDVSVEHKVCRGNRMYLKF